MKNHLRLDPQKPTRTTGPGESWWYEDDDGIWICYAKKVGQAAHTLIFLSWAKVKGALKRKMKSMVR